MINRELKQSILYNYINGNLSELTEIEKLLSACFTDSININIVYDLED